MPLRELKIITPAYKSNYDNLFDNINSILDKEDSTIQSIYNEYSNDYFNIHSLICVDSFTLYL